MEEIFKKQYLLTGYLEYLINSQFRKSHNNNDANSAQRMPTVDIITPSDPHKRGSQLSLVFSVPLKKVQHELERRGVVVSRACPRLFRHDFLRNFFLSPFNRQCDVRQPNVMRVAPAPLYNSFTDVFKFVCVLREVIVMLDGQFEAERLTARSRSECKSDSCHSECNGSGASAASATNGSNGMASSDSEPDSLVGSNTL